MSSPCRILYVDDNKDSRELVSMMLRYSNLNYEITSIESAEKAIVFIAGRRFDLCILDYALPEMSGIDLCRHIRKNDSEMPILFFTAMARPINQAEAIVAGANEYLIKPNDLEKLVETVKRLLNENSSTSCEPLREVEFHNSVY